MVATAIPVRPAGGVERDGRVDGGRAWVKGEQPPTQEELTALGDDFLPEEPAPPEAKKHVLPPRGRYSPPTVLANGPEAFGDPEEEGPRS
ncbi:MAG: hypothetical protein HY980_02215, partial [Candidatus Magasanikbacteria bacterium]|nr:hypothetical protein [Candidatus Magasanikbacteria bacterium]